MISTVINILLQGIEPENGLLRENGFAKRLLDCLINGKKVPDDIELLGAVQKKEIPEKIDYSKSTKNLDRRIKWLLLNNIRQYSPHLNKSPKELNYYALNFCLGDNIASAIFLGANGTGKTTLFSSLEYLYKGYSDIAASHGKSDDQTGFLRSVGENPTDWEIRAILEKNEEMVENRLSDFELGAPFCSECDYFEITRDWDRINKYIAYQMGYGELWLLLERLSKLKTLILVAQKYAKNENEIYSKQQSIENPDLNEKEKSDISQEIQFLQKKREQIMGTFLSERGVDNNLVIERFITDEDSDVISEERFVELYRTLDYLEDCWTGIINSFKTVINPIMDKMMKGHLLSSFESINISTIDKRMKMELIIQIEDEKHILSPVEYFNTFRLKLFCLAIKMAIYCSVKIMQQINIPFFVDDIFDSSDFHNRSKINSFIWHMLEAHDQIIQNAVENRQLNKSIPIQIIFFTQDNIIAENVYRGMREYIYEHGKEKEMNVKFGRLFRPTDIDLMKKDKNKILQLSIDGDNVNILEVADCYPKSFNSGDEYNGK